MEETKPKMEVPKKCPDCGGELIKANGETYCKKCGLVLE